MLATIRSLGVKGIGGYGVSVEVFVSNGLVNFDIVGLPDAAVREARERVRAAIKSNGFKFPVSRVTVNLAPADTKKAGTVYDLPIMLGILAATGVIRQPKSDCAFFGELSLNGTLRPVSGALPMAVAAAREALAGILANYRGWRRCEIILVFDAYKVKGNPGSMEKKNGIYIVYTKEAQTADSYIERATYDLGKNHRVRVATSDNMEQVIILGHGALRISARAFEEEVAEAEGQISDLIERWNVRDFDLRRVRATATIIDK